MYRAAFFDVGETLVYAHPSPAEIMAAVCAEAGWPVASHQIEAADNAVGPRVMEKQRAGELYSISAENSARFWQWVYHLVLDQLDAPATLRPLLAQRFHERFMALETWRLYPDALPLLQALQAHRQQGLVMGVLSNWEDWLEALLARLEISHYFDFLVISAGVRLEKPDPAIFRAALDRAGVAAEEAVHLGDSLHADVGGARAAGVTPVLLDRRGRYDPARAPGVRIIRSLAEFPAVLAARDKASS
jgi:putative hydrolase of the HAD superfamily